VRPDRTSPLAVQLACYTWRKGHIVSNLCKIGSGRLPPPSPGSILWPNAPLPLLGAIGPLSPLRDKYGVGPEHPRPGVRTTSTSEIPRFRAPIPGCCMETTPMPPGHQPVRGMVARPKLGAGFDCREWSPGLGWVTKHIYDGRSRHFAFSMSTILRQLGLEEILILRSGRRYCRLSQRLQPL
jgi:hypothetical protein